MSQITVNRTGLLPLLLTVDSNGGVAGLASTVLLRDLANAWPLDWSDLTFKAAGHVLLRAPMTDLGGGVYYRALDLSTVTNLPNSSESLSAEFQTSGAVQGAASDLVELTKHLLDDEEADTGVSVRNTLANLQSLAAGKVVRTGDEYAYRDSLDASTRFTNRDGDTERTPV